MIKDISCDKLFDIIKGSSLRSDIVEHSKRVYKICQMIVDELNSSNVKVEVDREMLYKAAYLHDMGKIEYTGDAHPFMSVIHLYTLFDCSKNEKYARKLSSIIVSHKGYFCPHASIAMEAAILRMADKIDKYNKSDAEEAKNSCEENLQKITKYLNKINCAGVGQFQKACEDVRKKVKKKVKDRHDT